MSEYDKTFTKEEAQTVAEQIGINWDNVDFNIDDFTNGMNIELEHGSHDPETDVTGDDPNTTGKIAWAHLKEHAKYYQYLEEMEEKLEALE